MKHKRLPAEVIVAKSCPCCNSIFVPWKSQQIYCNESCLRKGTSLRLIRDYNLSKEFVNKHFSGLRKEQIVEGLGTYLTTHKFSQYRNCRMARKPDGTPDFEKELKLVRAIKRNTFNPKPMNYSPTQGDLIRDIKIGYD